MTRFKQYTTLDPQFVAKKLQEFFKEDNIQKDITTISTQENNKEMQAILIAKEPLVFAGMEIIQQGFSDCVIDDIAKDGTCLQSGDIITTIQGGVSSILKKERVVLNLIQRLSGIASTTYQLSQITNQYKIELLDTRRTTPGLRMFEKFAVTVGGGVNHRFSLQDAIMIKDNHLASMDGSNRIARAIDLARKNSPELKIEVEADTVVQARQAADAGADIILLDNMSVDELREAVSVIDSRSQTEASGRININNVREIASTGVNYISVGAITHSAPAVDVSLEIIK